MSQAVNEPKTDCAHCPRLAEFRLANRALFPDFFNAPVRSFGSDTARLLVVGLAPGLKGANRTGRPFTGDYAGVLLYRTLLDHGFASGTYGADPADGLELIDCMITNAVRCVPPENKPTPAEIKTCQMFLTGRINTMKGLQIIIALGRIAHDSVLAALGAKRSLFPFTHGAKHKVDNRMALFDSYHCSRYNTSTRVLTPQMFDRVFAAARAELP